MRPQPELAEEILRRLRQRGPGKSICPGEVARAVCPCNWRPWMEPVRQAARELAADGRLRITRKDQTLDPDGDWKGPVRFRLP